MTNSAFRSETEVEQKHRKLAMAAGWFVEKVKGVRKGFPDRFYAKAGRIVLLEWKKENNGRTAVIQALRHKQLREAGVEVYVVKTLDEANEILGIP